MSCVCFILLGAHVHPGFDWAMEKGKGIVARIVLREKVGKLFMRTLQVSNDHEPIRALLQFFKWVELLLLLGSVVNIHNGLKEVSFCFSGIIFAFF